jgi:hypothetical protein
MFTAQKKAADWPPDELKGLLAKNRPDRAGIDAGLAIGAEILVNDMKITAFADRLDWTAVNTGGTIRTVFRNVMAPHNEPPHVCGNDPVVLRMSE